MSNKFKVLENNEKWNKCLIMRQVCFVNADKSEAYNANKTMAIQTIGDSYYVTNFITSRVDEYSDKKEAWTKFLTEGE